MMRLSAAFAVTAVLALGACGHPDTALQKGAPGALPPPDARTAAPAAPAPAPTQAAVRTSAPQAETRKPFVVIRFDGSEPDYARPLYDALQTALQRKPGVAFDLVAVTRDPDAAQRDLANVLRAITGMGMPADRLSLAAAAAEDETTDEVWIYVR